MSAPEYAAWCNIVGIHCPRPYDCHTCPGLQNLLPDDRTCLWICPTCARDRRGLERYYGSKSYLAGAYGSGECASPACLRENRASGFLQLAVI